MSQAKTLASIAAPNAASTPTSAPVTHKENAKERAAIDKGLAEIGVDKIRVDGLVSVEADF
jgi:hypothetical protein